MSNSSSNIGSELKKFLPCDIDGMHHIACAVQANYFTCGGIAIGASISHKIADGTSFIMFMKTPQFQASTLFPPTSTFSGFQPENSIIKEKLVLKRFVFSSASIVACNNALPTLAKLHHRHIVTTEICNGCQDQTEDTLHALWFCKEIACVSLSMEWFHQDVAGLPESFNYLFSRVMHSKDDFRLELFSITAWLLWNRHNAKHFGHPVHPLTKICSMAGTLLQEFLAIQSEPPAPPDPIVTQQWRPPKNNFYKVNFDAATFRSTNSVGIGVIIRDCAGEVIGALSLPIPMPQSVAAAEALACRRAVKFATEIGLTRVVFEGDLAVIINALTTANGNQTSYGNIIEDICALASGFQLVDFHHVPRACNSVADALAKKASTVTSLQVWLADSPPDIIPLVLRDAFVVREVH